MNRDTVIAGIVAVGFHAALLFALKLQSAPIALPAGDTTMDVNLVDGGPAADAAAAPSVAQTPPEPEPTPPEPVPPVTTPVPPPPEVTPQPMTIPEPSPQPAPPPTPPPQQQPPARHVPSRPAHSSVATTKASGAVTGASTEARGSGAAAQNGGMRGQGSSGVRERFNPKPAYPPEAERAHITGRVELAIEVGADGHVISVSVKQSSGFAVLDNAAVQGVRRWIFEPARVAGLAVAATATVPVVFGPRE